MNLCHFGGLAGLEDYQGSTVAKTVAISFQAFISSIEFVKSSAHSKYTLYRWITIILVNLKLQMLLYTGSHVKGVAVAPRKVWLL
jgi:hypothetical protein